MWLILDALNVRGLWNGSSRFCGVAEGRGLESVAVRLLESLPGVEGFPAKTSEECLNRKAGANAFGSTKM